MAMTVLADVSAALSLVFRDRLQTQINGTTVLPFLLPVVPGDGKVCSWTVEFTGAADAAASAEGVARSSSDADAEIPVPASLAWAQYDKTSSVSDLSAAAVASNFNPASIASVNGDSLLGQLMKQTRRLVRGIAADCYGGNPGATPPELAGAALAIDSSGTFAGIIPGTYTEWVSVEQAATYAALSFADVRAFFTAIYDSCGELPEFVTCNSTVFNALRNLYTDYEVNSRQVGEMELARGGGLSGTEPRAVKLSAGMRAFEIDQVPFVLDRDATANTMYAWNTNYVEIQQLYPHRGILDTGVDAIEALLRRLARDNGIQVPRANIEGLMPKSAGLMPAVKILGDRGLSKEANVNVFGQIKWARRNAFGKLALS